MEQQISQTPHTIHFSPVSVHEYAEAVARLSKTARHMTSGGRAAAQVLLSAYNGNEFQLDVVDLCLMDEDNLADAFTVMQGRARLGQEPHTLLSDGDALFQALWKQWEHLHISRRGQGS